MRFQDSLKTSLIGLKTNKFQSALTTLGIIISIAAIIMIMSVGRSAERLILDQISGFAADMMAIRPGKEPSGPSDIGDTLFSESLKPSDLEALQNKSNVPGLEEIVPAVIVPGTVSFQGETDRPIIFGWSAEFMGNTLGIFPAEGENFTQEDIDNFEHVAVIGYDVRKELFGDSDAIGEEITIKNQNFRVVGVFGEEGQVGFFDVDDSVILPYSTAQKSLLGINHYHEIMVRAESPEVVGQVARDITLTLRETHNITDPEDDDFYIVTLVNAIEQIQGILRSLTIFLASVVAIALVVGGIGVMNIMLVSVTERTHEIGLRKAVGATNNDIMTQFLLEAVILTSLGGFVGIISGSVIAFLMSLGITRFTDLDWPFTLPVSSIFIGFGVSALVGVVFGLYPAKKASKKSPIEALRYE